MISPIVAPAGAASRRSIGSHADQFVGLEDGDVVGRGELATGEGPPHLVHRLPGVVAVGTRRLA